MKSITPLQEALLSERSRKSKSILKSELDEYQEFDAVDKFNRCDQIVHFLIDRKINVNIPNSDYPILLHFAILNRHTECFDYLLKSSDININAILPKVKSSLLHAAAINGTPAMVKTLLKRGADVNAKCITGSIPLHHACGDHGINFVDGKLLHTFTMHRSEEKAKIVKYLLQHGSALEAELSINRFGIGVTELMTSLQLACEFRGSLKIVNLLLQHGANCNVVKGNGETLLHLSVRWNSYDLMELLLEKGIDPNLRDNVGQTPIFHSFPRRYSSHPLSTKLLIQYGADIHVVDNFGNTPLHKACSTFHFKDSVISLRSLLRLKADINVCNQEGRTPLDIALAEENYNSVWFTRTERKRVMKCLEILCAFVAKLRACNKYVSQKNLDLLSNDIEFKRIVKICDLEIDRMKAEKIIDSYSVKYIDFLTGDLQRLTALARNKDIMKKLTVKRCNEMFPKLSNFLKDAIDEVKARESAYTRCSLIFKKLVKRLKLKLLPLLVVEEIFGYLSAQDLRNFEESFGQVHSD